MAHLLAVSQEYQAHTRSNQTNRLQGRIDVCCILAHSQPTQTHTNTHTLQVNSVVIVGRHRFCLSLNHSPFTDFSVHTAKPELAAAAAIMVLANRSAYRANNKGQEEHHLKGNAARSAFSILQMCISTFECLCHVFLCYILF